MASCAVCGTSVRDGATHCTTCGTATGFTAAPPDAGRLPAPVVSPPSPFEDNERWLDPAPGRGAPAGPAQTRPPARASRSRTSIIAVVVLAAVVAAVLAVVAVPRLFPSVDPQKFVGTWIYTGNSADTVTIMREGVDFTLDFVGSTARSRPCPACSRARDSRSTTRGWGRRARRSRG